VTKKNKDSNPTVRFCPYNHPNKGEILGHLAQFHFEHLYAASGWKCAFCSVPFGSEIVLIRHIVVEHDILGPQIKFAPPTMNNNDDLNKISAGVIGKSKVASQNNNRPKSDGAQLGGGYSAKTKSASYDVAERPSGTDDVAGVLQDVASGAIDVQSETGGEVIANNDGFIEIVSDDPVEIFELLQVGSDLVTSN
jgi:hypothetical protein